MWERLRKKFFTVNVGSLLLIAGLLLMKYSWGGFLIGMGIGVWIGEALPRKRQL